MAPFFSAGQRVADDREGEARERRRAAGGRQVVARYFTQQHSRPELLDSVVQMFVDTVAERVDRLRHNARLHFWLPTLTVRERGDLLVLCEDAVGAATRDGLREEVTFSAQAVAMLRITHDLAEADRPAGRCTSTTRRSCGSSTASILGPFQVILRRVSQSRGNAPSRSSR